MAEIWWDTGLSVGMIDFTEEEVPSERGDAQADRGPTRTIVYQSTRTIGNAVRLRLPEATPVLHLRWTRYWRRIEQKMRENPLLEEIASRASAPILHGGVARFISSHVFGAIERQAREATSHGLPNIAPIVEGDRRLLQESVTVMTRRAAWLQDHNVAMRLGVPPLEEEPANLRARVLASMYLQLTAIRGAR